MLPYDSFKLKNLGQMNTVLLTVSSKSNTKELVVVHSPIALHLHRQIPLCVQKN